MKRKDRFLKLLYCSILSVSMFTIQTIPIYAQEESYDELEEMNESLEEEIPVKEEEQEAAEEVEEEQEQKCGEEATFTLEKDVLHIQGKGTLFAYETKEEAPWYDQKETVKEIVLEEGITSIQKNNFTMFKDVVITIPQSVEFIDKEAFDTVKTIKIYHDCYADSYFTEVEKEYLDEAEVIEEVEEAKTDSEVLTTPPVIQLKSVIAGNRKITVRWYEEETAEFYHLYRKEDDGEWIEIANNVTETVFVDTDVSLGITYSYKILSSIGEEFSEDSEEMQARLAMGMVTMDSVVPGNRQITIRWREANNADTYRLYRKTNDGSYKILAKGLEALSYVDSDVEFGNEYTYTVRGENGTYISSKIQKLSTTLSLGMVELIKVEPGNKQITIEWNETENADSYRLYRKINDGTYKVIARGLETLSYVDTDVALGNEYTYTVRGENGSSISTKTQKMSATLSLNMVELVKVEPGDKQITIEWKATQNADTYRLYRKINDGTYKVIARGLETLNYVDTDVALGNEYTYTVRGENGSSISTKTQKMSASLSLGIPELIKVEPENKQIVIEWKAALNADSYRVYRKTDDGNYKVIAKSLEELSYVDTDVVVGKDYTYVIRGVNNGLLSGNSQKMSARLVLGNVELIGATVRGPKVIVEWQDTLNAVSYRVYRKEEGGSWRVIADKVTDLYYDDLDAEIDVKYYYTVRAFGTDGVLGTDYDHKGVTATITEKKNFKISYLQQNDYRWGNTYFGYWNMSQSGCYQTVYTMAINAIKQRHYIPTDIARWSYENTEFFNRGGAGTNAENITCIAQEFGLHLQEAYGQSGIMEALKKGKIIVGAEGPGKFTIPGFTHAVLLNGYDDGYTYAYDPYNPGNNGWISVTDIWNQRSQAAGDWYNGTCFFSLY